ncbi:MAG: PA2779 family protein [Proteobacteria bacterium]|nr:PA2779 family protein [Pseudomonadota bacterium]
MNTFIGNHLLQRITLFLVLIMSMMSFVPNVDASFVPSSQSSSVELRAQDMTSVQNTLESKMVKERLATLGYSKDEINARLGLLSDGELHSLATQLGSLDAGSGALGLVIAILVIVILTLVIMKMT